MTNSSPNKYPILLEKRSPLAEQVRIAIFQQNDMDKSKIVAVVTGAISLALAIAYLLVVQFLDFRGEMIPAPVVEMLPLAWGILVG
jgi:adenine/guanine phosphoribosyltransferase-like PRPP-binding protein